MILKKQRFGKAIATLAVVIGIIVFAFSSAQDKSVNKDTKTLQTTDAFAQEQETESTATAAPTAGDSTDDAGNAAAPAPTVKKPARDFMYTVKNGDTLYDLALTYGVSVDDIKYANNLTSDNLRLDQRLSIPASGRIKAEKPARHVVSAKPRKVYQVASRSSGRIVGELVAWETAAKLFAIGETATVIDVETGLSFRIKRKGGHNHADNEPLTAEDSAVMKKIYGGSWSWNRRAVVLKVGDRKIAASMAGMPHGSENISNNDFSGHFDIHFKGSMTHGSEYTKTRTPVVDSQHQAMVRKAAGL
ncbi:MAG: LysM peptidoglycan-binding domain-containing protein [Bacillota bacterium]